MKPFNLEEAKAGKSIVCRDGTPAKFIAYVPEAKPELRVVAFVGDLKHCLNYPEDGIFKGHDNGLHCYNLLMAPERKTVWVNIYNYDLNANIEHALKNHAGHAWASEEIANHASLKQGRIACIPVTYTEGDGL